MLKAIDGWLFIPALLLSLLGLSVIFSLSAQEFHSQLIFLLITLGIFFIILLFDSHFLFSLAPFLYVTSLLLILGTYLFGIVSHGSMRWLGIAGFQFQPSEIAKPFLALGFGFWATRLDFKKGKDFLYFLLLFVPPLALIFRQPDLGSALVAISLWGGIVLRKGINFKLLAIFLVFLLVTAPLIWGILKPYQKSRIETFLNPQADPLGTSYNQIQATIAVGSGGFWGKGLGQGTQSHLQFLPEKQTDFIFATMAEELGFLGTMTVLVLYLTIFGRVLFLASKAESLFAQLVDVGIFSFLWFQTFIHIGMNVGLLPVTGVTLPFVSAGGSSLLSSWLSLGLVMLVSQEKSKDNAWEIR